MIFSEDIDINIEIPEHLIGHKSDEVDFSLLQGKNVIGLMGYSKSGKDTVGRILSNQVNFKRVAFGDVMKRDMNKYLVSKIKVDLENKGTHINVDDIDFLNPKTPAIKEVLRPYMIWFGEEMRRINGAHYWTNRALFEIGDSHKVVMTDIRRMCELDIFMKKSNSHILVHISQYALTDSDELTVSAIRKAQELWLIDHTIFVDSRVPKNNRKEHVEEHVNNLKLKFPHYFL